MIVINFAGKAQAGKDTSCSILKSKLEQLGNKVLILHFADYLKHLCRQYFTWNGVKDDPGREILQVIGTDKVRNRNPDFWVNTVIEFLKVFQKDYDYFLIGDCRFPNEILKLRKEGFDTFAVRVNRPNYDNGLTEQQKQHISETALDNFVFDYQIENDKDGLKNLENRIDEFIEYLKEQ
jgi:hypothetical protein